MGLLLLVQGLGRDVARALATPDGKLAEMRHAARATAHRITPELMAGRIMAAFDEAMK